MKIEEDKVKGEEEDLTEEGEDDKDQDENTESEIEEGLLRGGAFVLNGSELETERDYRGEAREKK